MTEQSERVSAAVPTVADTFTAVGTIRAPAGMKRLRHISIGLAPDQTLASTSVRYAVVIRIIGSGLLEQSPHDYVGPCGGEFGLTDEAPAVSLLNADYDVDIPIGLGGDINIQAETITEVLAAGSITVGLIFDDEASKTKNSMADVLTHANPTAADAWQNMGTLNVPQGEGDKAPKKITRILIGMGIDQGIAAFSLRHALNIRLSGAGLKGGGLHEFVGPHGDSGIVVIGGNMFLNVLLQQDVNMDVNPAGVITIEAILITELPTAGSVVVGLMYE